jgi:predicted O-methyltransferase YrrM
MISARSSGCDTIAAHRLSLSNVFSKQKKVGMQEPFPDGHFYSPIVDRQEVARREASLWPPRPTALGIDFNDAAHEEMLATWFPKFIADYDYPDEVDEAREPHRFFNNNSQFGWLDSRALFVMMRRLEPRRVIEVGSGFSSLLFADINRRFLGERVDITCIEPYPRPFLESGVPGITRVVKSVVQEVPLETFEALGENDILFIDSSHVAKTGSDVNYLYFEVLPRLKPGVVIHIHDIFLPHEYLKDWVLREGRSWNEQYVLRALLMYSTAFKVLFGCSYAFDRFPDLVQHALARPDGAAFAGGSLWLSRQAG